MVHAASPVTCVPRPSAAICWALVAVAKGSQGTPTAHLPCPKCSCWPWGPGDREEEGQSISSPLTIIRQLGHHQGGAAPAQPSIPYLALRSERVT